MINIKTQEEIQVMREGGKILASIMAELVKNAKSGTTTKYLDDLAYRLIIESGAKPSFLNYRGFPASICASINDEVVHGLPSERKLRGGDLFKIDLGIFYKGFHTDSATTVLVGNVLSKVAGGKKKKLMAVTKKSLDIAISLAKPGNTLGDIGFAVEDYVHRQGLEVVRDLVGHGIGRTLHEEPEVPNYGKPGFGPQLKPGMVIAIEPMVVTGKYETIEGEDGFAFKTIDGGLAAHFEHTVAITKGEPLVLTKM